MLGGTSSGSPGAQGLQAKTLPERPDLSLEKTVSPAETLPGSTITYTLSLANKGAVTADGVSIEDRMPVSITVLSVISGGVAISDRGTFPTYTWDVQDLEPGQAGGITITGVLSDSLGPHIFTNTATIDGSGQDLDSSNDSAPAALTVLGPELPVTDSCVYLPLVLRDR